MPNPFSQLSKSTLLASLQSPRGRSAHSTEESIITTQRKSGGPSIQSITFGRDGISQRVDYIELQDGDHASYKLAPQEVV